MASSPFAAALISAGSLLAPGAPALAAPDAIAQATALIVQPSGIFVVEDILGRVNAALLIKTSQGSAISLGVPIGIDLSSEGGQVLSLRTTTHLSVTGTSLAGDVISVSIGVAEGAAPRAVREGFYRGSMTVLAQYN